jgi:hypothetical protein
VISDVRNSQDSSPVRIILLDSMDDAMETPRR